MNDLMSGTMHRFWKDEFVKMIGPVVNLGNERTVVLDVAGGTGDISFRILEAMKREPVPKLSPSVIVCDINPEMLRVGRGRAQTLGYSIRDDPLAPAAAVAEINRPQVDSDLNEPELSFMEGNAEILERIPDNSVDLYTIAFGIRNVTHVQKAVEQAFRVLKPGGRFMCLEFSKVENPALRTVYDLVSCIARIHCCC
jgi:2-methoxy-6-polyprenyl-1,4-benzoquinol methylase